MEANLARWTGQVVPGEGESPRRETFDQGDLKVTSIELGGTLKASQIGSFPTTDMPNYRLFAAVVEGQGGPWFFRAVGPDATMQEQRGNFNGMLRSVNLQ